ncbi:putative oxidoreductase [Arachis hypogaea]|nr:putative oxidoreductase [Arachis hypogaea]
MPHSTPSVATPSTRPGASPPPTATRRTPRCTAPTRRFWTIPRWTPCTFLCRRARTGVQLMDGTMWMHHPRTNQMKDFLSDAHRFGQLKSIQTYFTFAVDPDFLENDIRAKPDLDALGSLGDEGVIMACGALLHWEDGKVATFYCSFMANLAMDITAPESGFDDLVTKWASQPSKHTVNTDLPQEVLMESQFLYQQLVLGVQHLWKEIEKTSFALALRIHVIRYRGVADYVQAKLHIIRYWVLQFVCELQMWCINRYTPTVVYVDM